MTELLVVLTGLVLLLTLVAVLVLGRDRLSAWSSPAADGIEVEPAPSAPLLLPERFTAEELEDVAFHVRRRGYDRGEVRAVLAAVARQLPPQERSPAAVPEA
ncbi:DivIVA domain-containing protein [Kocuria sp. M1R5S2]|uniref:DivIVA domain-containing protein n=1 Tax=Kocuria rhizosphaerae TaxID=3376285 RepID=UPI0037A44F68